MDLFELVWKQPTITQTLGKLREIELWIRPGGELDHPPTTNALAAGIGSLENLEKMSITVDVENFSLPKLFFLLCSSTVRSLHLKSSVFKINDAQEMKLLTERLSGLCLQTL